VARVTQLSCVPTGRAFTAFHDNQGTPIFPWGTRFLLAHLQASNLTKIRD